MKRYTISRGFYVVHTVEVVAEDEDHAIEQAKSMPLDWYGSAIYGDDTLHQIESEKDCDPENGINRDVTCLQCGNVEGMGSDDARHHFNTFKFDPHDNNKGDEEYKCLECGSLNCIATFSECGVD